MEKEIRVEDISTELAKSYVKSKIVGFTRSAILSLELTNKAKKGAEKMQDLVDNFLSGAKKYIAKEKEIDRKWMPDIIESLAEDTIDSILTEASKNLDIRAIAQEVFNIERSKGVI